MVLSKSIKQTLGSDEQVKKLFSFGNRHIYVRLAASLLKWLFIAIAAAVIIFILYKLGETAANGGLLPTGEVKNSAAGAASEKFFQDFWLKTSLIGAFIFCLIFLPISLFYHLYFLRVANTFVLTDRRIIVKKGWLNTSVKSVDYDRITDVSVDQSFLDKIFYASGTLSISTAGGDGYELTLNCVDAPHELKKMLNDLKDGYRKQAYPTTPLPPSNEQKS